MSQPHEGPAEPAFGCSPAACDIVARAARKAAFTSFVFDNSHHFHTPFDEAAATSTYKTDDESLERSAFSARQALAPGSGYWCSTGRPKPDEVVTWSGLLHRRRPVSGIKISWAYAPEEVRVRSTADGMHWDEVVGWHTPQSKDVSFEEDMVFDRPRNVMQVKVEMRGHRPWGYVGINQSTLVM